MEKDVTSSQTELTIGVRELVTWASRSGDLDLSFAVGTRSVEAIRAHQKVQRSRPEGYSAEVSVSGTEAVDGFVLTVSGRMDGLYSGALVESRTQVVVDEIKTTTRELARFREREVAQHRDQARVYACLYARQQGLAEIATQLTYYQMQSGETLELVVLHTIGELEKFYDGLVATYLAWARRMANWYRTRDASLARLDFPFTAYRRGQREMAVAVYRCVRDRGQMVIQAPTGIGKTMATLFPALRALGEGHIERVFYLTARTTGRRVAEDALRRIREGGGRVKAITLTAKDRICFHPGTACTPEECRYARGHYDRLGKAMEELFRHDDFGRSRVAAVAEACRVCPFEFSLDLSLWADCVICDYNYVFDPRVYLRRFFGESEAPCALLVDEAHNLVDRSRDMFSGGLSKQAILDTRRAVKEELPRIYRELGRVNRELLAYKKECDHAGGQASSSDPPESLYPLLRDLLKRSEGWLVQNQPADCREELLELYFAVNTFMRVADAFDETYATCTETQGRDLRLRLFCMDPAPQVAAVLEKCRAVVFFSATMTPVTYFRKTLGCRDDAANLILDSPFPPENQATLAYTAVSTLYRDRERSRTDVSRALLALATQKRGNYLFFFPSYRYMEMVYEDFVATPPEKMQVLIQEPGMSEEERDTFLGHFARRENGTLAAFAVMGGIFGEGIDLVGDRLTGAAIVGVGLPGISPERELIRDYFERQEGAGFAFAYQFPGINRVLQAAGRVIRTGKDRGVVLLIDRRFAAGTYASLLPAVWRTRRVVSPQRLGDETRRFWESVRETTCESRRTKNGPD